MQNQRLFRQQSQSSHLEFSHRMAGWASLRNVPWHFPASSKGQFQNLSFAIVCEIFFPLEKIDCLTGHQPVIHRKALLLISRTKRLWHEPTFFPYSGNKLHQQFVGMTSNILGHRKIPRCEYWFFPLVIYSSNLLSESALPIISMHLLINWNMSCSTYWNCLGVSIWDSFNPVGF